MTNKERENKLKALQWQKNQVMVSDQVSWSKKKNLEKIDKEIEKLMEG
jgi:putative ribosome biogenesis GTPase RsgA